MKRTASIASNLLRAGLAVAALVGAYLAWSWSHALHPGTDTYMVKPGTGLSALAAELQRRGAIWETRSFLLLGYVTFTKREFKVGEYRFRDGINAAGILEQVGAGRVVEYPFRIGEGATFRQVLAELERAPHLARTLQGMTYAQIMTKLDAPDTHPEGRFYPDTYFYATGNTDLSILRRAHAKMQGRLQREWENRDPAVPLKSPDEALVLASIVEKETGKAEERRMIAGVFVNRLKIDMRLQTDPTVIYGLGEKFDGNLRKRDLSADTPYNTYTRRGLPPTPIAMPSGEALYAALHPESTRALFFVSRGDGSHVFSDNVEQHNRAVSKYQLGGRPFPPPN
ncbi:MAG TPA: endolytic transglycosylase MltG [Burkholderiales bacterium]|nr:endolytic transglycosylase MltG [Burkholderiales bacterium]